MRLSIIGAVDVCDIRFLGVVDSHKYRCIIFDTIYYDSSRLQCYRQSRRSLWPDLHAIYETDATYTTLIPQPRLNLLLTCTLMTLTLRKRKVA